MPWQSTLIRDFSANLGTLTIPGRWTEQKNATIVDYVIGKYVANNPAGIRSHPYSTDV